MTTIVGRRSGSIVVQSVKGSMMTVQCDCGVVREMPSPAIHRAHATCGDRAAHPLRVRRKWKVRSYDYRYNWHRKHTTCAGWADYDAFAAAVGERPKGHGLTILTGHLASCGACPGCRAMSAARNVAWTPGVLARDGGIDYGGQRMSKAEAARREGISRAAMGARLLRGKPAKAS